MDLLRALAGIARMKSEPFEERMVARTEVGGLIVSTVYAYDIEMYEIALLDREGAHPVRRYETREQAVAGHTKWCGLAPDLVEVTQLGYGLFDLPDKQITLVREVSP